MGRLIVSVLCVLLAACSAKEKVSLQFDPTEPLRVAVIPFATRDSDGTLKNEESRLFVDNLGLISSKLNETPAQIVRRFTFAELEHSGLDLISPALIDIDLPHHGFALDNGSLDLQKLYATSPRELCTDFLDCDAVLYGTITRWDRSYYGLEAVNAVGVEYRLVSARDGKTLFTSSVEDSSSRGISKGPTGFSDILIAPIQGLDSAIIVEVAEKVVKRALSQLRIDTRPEYLQSAPPSIYAASQKGPDSDRNAKSPLVVVAYGSPQSAAAFKVGDSFTVPMVEETPGHYYGEFSSPPGAAIEARATAVVLTDKFGRVTTHSFPPA